MFECSKIANNPLICLYSSLLYFYPEFDWPGLVYYAYLYQQPRTLIWIIPNRKRNNLKNLFHFPARGRARVLSQHCISSDIPFIPIANAANAADMLQDQTLGIWMLRQSTNITLLPMCYAKHKNKS